MKPHTSHHALSLALLLVLAAGCQNPGGDRLNGKWRGDVLRGFPVGKPVVHALSD